MELTNFEKRLLLVALRFFYRAGPHFVSMLWEGDSPPKQSDWEQCKVRIKKLYKQIKESIDDDRIPEPTTCRDHLRKQSRL
jgi:hypothetical protein